MVIETGSLLVAALASALCFLVLIRKHIGLAIGTLCVLIIVTTYYAYAFNYMGLDVVALFYGLPTIFLSFIAYGFVGNKKITSNDEIEFSEDEIWKLRLPSSKGNQTITNIKAGIGIVAAAGGGKTESPIYTLLKHFSEKQFTGIIYDYKDGELTEIAYPFWIESGIEFRTICFHDVNKSWQINPLSPKYLKDEDDIKDIVKVLFANLTQGEAKGGNAYFFETAEKTLAAIILRTLEDHPSYCTLPHVIGIALTKSLEELEAYISKSMKASVLGAAFLRSTNEKAKNDVLSTLSNALSTIASPNIFAVLSGDDFDLRLNNPDHKAVVSFINQPKKEKALAPVMAMCIQAITGFMMQRNSNHSFLLLDEAPTINLKNMERIPSTMRSYGLTTVFTVQDKSLSDLTYSEKRTKAIFANLTTYFLGLAKDPDTAEFNERMLEYIKEDNVSINKSANWLFGKGETRKSISKKEVRKFRAFEFGKMKPGEFIFLQNADAVKVQFKRADIKKKPITDFKNWTRESLDANYYKILDESKKLN